MSLIIGKKRRRPSIHGRPWTLLAITVQTVTVMWKMCHVVKGVIRGLGERYGESFHIEETQCMHDGANECILNVFRVH